MRKSVLATACALAVCVISASAAPTAPAEARDGLAISQYGNLTPALSGSLATSALKARSLRARPATVFVSPHGSNSGRCTRPAPCSSFDRAYHVAKPGAVVEIAAGTYQEQLVSKDATKKAAADVVFRPAAHARVTVYDNLVVDGSHVTFRGFTLSGDWRTDQQTSDVTFQNLTVNGGIFINSSTNIRVIGGSVGGTQDSKPQIGAWPPGTRSTNILVDGVTFHDITRTGSGVHVECLLVAGIDGLIVRNSRFRNCSVFDLSIGEMNDSGPPRNILIENNFFGGSDGYFSLQFNTNSTSLTNVLIRNNSSTQEMSLGNDIPALQNVRVIANVAPYHARSCDRRIVYEYNVWEGVRCGVKDVNAPSRFRNPGALDFHLQNGSRAIGHGSPKSFPKRDIDGQKRPQGRRVDAGADERR
jgi:hypothetical protein